MPKLLVLSGPHSGEILDIQFSSTLLSLGPTEEILLNAPSPYSIQTYLTHHKDGNYFLSPGKDILLNGESFSQPRRLSHGDFFNMGAIQLLFDEGQAVRKSDTQTNYPAVKLKKKEEFHITSHKTFTDADSIVSEMIQSKDQESAKRRLASLFKVTHTIAQVQSISQLFEELVEIIFLEFSAERCLILLKEPEKIDLKIVTCRNRQGKNLEKPQISRTILTEVLENRTSVLTENALEDARFEAHLSIAEHEIHSLMAVPLMSKIRVYGMIQLDTHTINQAFQPGDLEMLAGIAMQASTALEKFELEQIKAEKEKLEQELKIAAEIQRFLLPSQIPHIPQLQIGLKYQLSQHLGGDYYDFIDQGNGRWAIILADVSGHSTASALVMAMARTVLRNHCRQYTEPSKILELSNRIIKEDTTSFMYLTAFLLMYNAEQKTITYSGAGHPFPLLQRDHRLIRLEKGGRPLGLMRNSAYEQQAILLKPGDRLLLYTDGLSEAKESAEGQHFGEERIIQCIKDIPIQAGAQKTIHLIYQRLQEFTTDPLEDDLTLLLLQQE